jgi:hypothetical protein
MKSVDHLKMPECVMNQVPVYMDGRERLMYETMKDELFLQVLSKYQNTGTEGGLEGDRKALQ